MIGLGLSDDGLHMCVIMMIVMYGINFGEKANNRLQSM